MKKHCKDLESYLMSGAEPLPDALRTHLAQCEPCRRAWQLEQGYRRALQAARGEPTPVCDIPWARVQAKLAERAVARPRPLVWRFAPAFGVVAVALVTLSWLLSTNAPQPQITLNTEPATSITETLNLPPSVKTASAAPILSDTARIETPAAPQTPNTDRAQARLQTPEKPVQEQASDSMAVELHARIRPMEQPAATDNIGGNDYNTAPDYQVAALPLSQFRVGEGAEVHYLPFNYGNSPSEGANEHATVGSF